MNKEFTFHKLNAHGMIKADLIAREFDRLLEALNEMRLGATREMAITRTKLEEACFFAKKAMANQPENQIEYSEPEVK